MPPHSFHKHRSSMSPTPMHVVVASVLASLLPILASSSSTSSLLSITGDLAPSLLPFTLVMLVAGTGVAAAANAADANTSARHLQPWMPSGARASNANLNSRLGLGLSNGPSSRQLNATTLRSRLGADFNSNWMSIEMPSQATRNSTNVPPTDVDKELLEDLREMGFSYTDEHGDRRTMPSAVRSIVERWLLQRATCQVHYTWEDMGPMIWPRWVKQGYCDTDAPCSWPPGMHCASAESDTLRLLKWHCQRPDSNRKVRHVGSERRRVASGEMTPRSGEAKAKRSGKMQCRWKKIPFPVTSECFCSC